MKKLLIPLMCLTVSVPTIGIFVQQINSNSKFDPIDKFNTPYEMIEISNLMDKVISNPHEYDDIQQIQNLMVQSTIMLDEIYSESFFYQVSTKISQILNLFKEELESIETVEGSNFYQDIMKSSQSLSINFNAKIEDLEIKNLFIDYEKLKREEAIKFFDIYDRKITKLNFDLQLKQKSINDLNIRNAEIDEKLKGLSKENEIINDIFKILDFNLKLVGKVNELYSNGRSNIDVYYNSAEWHSENWGLAFIPFYGTGFSVNFKNNMNYAVRGIDTYITTFLDPKSNNYKEFLEMQEGLQNMRDQIMAIDPNESNWVGDLLGEAGLDESVSNALNNGVQKLINASSSMGYVGLAIKTINSFLTVGFQAKRMAETFKKELKPEYTKVELLLNENDKTISEAYKIVLATQKELSEKFDVNNKEMQKLRDELSTNLQKVEDENEKLESLKDEMNLINKSFISNMNNGIYADNYYWWQTNIISDIEIKSKVNSSYENIQTINFEKNIVYNKLLDKLIKSKMNQNVINNLKTKHELSNQNYNYIINI
ncbi:BAR domain-containing protein [Spiroplasma culicicola]|uniref:Uncharacterized protein n=1 Tax=Spiroplasma culicicola AES-1 TaxID=1276246 RepID=W6A6D0_9MOLU|nr:hypothetical protein [Spiroplasma culicicola]AHI52673.1 hypothetical protein SCULI_v1c03320 [Spiroplasma culicicola AES-1]